MIPASYAKVNGSAVTHNLNVIRKLAPGSKIMSVIKANAYGHGLIRIAKLLEDVDAFAVARASEGMLLRRMGINKRIVILEGFVCEQELYDLSSFDFDFVIHSIGQVDILERFKAQKKISTWLKFDTGMNRLGFKEDMFCSAYQRLSVCSSVNQPISLMTHLACADEMDNNFTSQQLIRFKQLVKAYPGEKSIANSAAIIAWPEAINDCDWVRPGIMMYGVSPFLNKTGADIGLKPVMSLHSRLIAIKNLDVGDAVGYSGTWLCKKKTTVGVVAIGYGDGYPRYTRAGAPVLINGSQGFLIGRVSMDMITVDITDLPNVQVGDLVTLWGDGLAIEEIAQYADTIPYTLVCGVTQRVEIKAV